MDNWNVLVLDIVHDNFANVRLAQDVSVPQEQQIAALEGRFHGPRKDDNDGRWRVGDDGKTLPHLQQVALAIVAGNQALKGGASQTGRTDHERRGKNEREVEQLCGRLPRILEARQHGSVWEDRDARFLLSEHEGDVDWSNVASQRWCRLRPRVLEIVAAVSCSVKRPWFVHRRSGISLVRTVCTDWGTSQPPRNLDPPVQLLHHMQCTPMRPFGVAFQAWSWRHNRYLPQGDTIWFWSRDMLSDVQLTWDTLFTVK